MRQTPNGAARAIAINRGHILARQRPKQSEVAIFTRSLAVLTEAGLPLDEAIAVASRTVDERGGRLTPYLERLRARVRSGESLSSAISGVDPAGRPVFGPVYAALVAAGEAGGHLSAVLGRLAGYQERSERLSAQVRSALAYPTLLLAAALLSLIVLVTVVLPRYEMLFETVGGDLPAVTRIVLAAADGIRAFGWLAVVAGIAAAGYWQWRVRNRPASVNAQRWLLSAPVIGPLITKIEMERIARALSELTEAGVSLPRAIELAAGVTRNDALADALIHAGGRLREGRRFSEALAEMPVVPALFVDLVAVGEQSATLPAMLRQSAELYAFDVETATRRLVAIIEPTVILGIGVVMAVIIASLFLAVTSINDLLAG